jgi:hypothetical protein
MIDERLHYAPHHIPKGPRCIIEAAARAHVDLLRSGDLHVIDIMVVPSRLDHRIGEPRHENVAHGVLAEEVVDAEELALLGASKNTRVQLLRGGQIVTEGLLYRDPAKSISLVQKADRREPLDDASKEARAVAR